MNIWIDDDYQYVIVSAILREEKVFIESVIGKNQYSHEEDRIRDIEYLNAINVILKNYEVQDGTECKRND